MRKIRSAVERIDDPEIRRRRLFDAPLFFSEKPVCRKLSLNMTDDQLFRRTVCISDQVYGVLVVNAKAGLGIFQ